MYATVANLERSKTFYDIVMKVLGFRRTVVDANVKLRSIHYGY